MTDKAKTDGELLQFPCRFPIKVMGRTEPQFRRDVLKIISRHASPLDETDIREAPSSTGNFVSLTVTIEATSQQQLDAIYRDLTASDAVLYCL